MYAMAKLIQTCISSTARLPTWACLSAWILSLAIIISALIVLGYIFLGGLTSAIYNEVLQFFLIVAGFLPLCLGRPEKRGRMEWSERRGCRKRYTHSWQGMTQSAAPIPSAWNGSAWRWDWVLYCRLAIGVRIFSSSRRAMAAKTR